MFGSKGAGNGQWGLSKEIYVVVYFIEVYKVNLIKVFIIEIYLLWIKAVKSTEKVLDDLSQRAEEASIHATLGAQQLPVKLEARAREVEHELNRTVQVNSKKWSCFHNWDSIIINPPRLQLV